MRPAAPRLPWVKGHTLHHVLRKPHWAEGLRTGNHPAGQEEWSLDGEQTVPSLRKGRWGTAGTHHTPSPKAPLQPSSTGEKPQRWPVPEGSGSPWETPGHVQRHRTAPGCHALRGLRPRRPGGPAMPRSAPQPRATSPRGPPGGAQTCRDDPTLLIGSCPVFPGSREDTPK